MSLHRLKETASKEGNFMQLDDNFNLKSIHSKPSSADENGTYVCYHQEKDSSHIELLYHPTTIFNMNGEIDDEEDNVKPGEVVYVDGSRYRAHHI
jgi:hypothetical protein